MRRSRILYLRRRGMRSRLGGERTEREVSGFGCGGMVERREKGATHALSLAGADVVRKALDIARIAHEDGSLDLLLRRSADRDSRARIPLVRVPTAAIRIVEDLTALHATTNRQLASNTHSLPKHDQRNHNARRSPAPFIRTCEYPTSTSCVLGHLVLKLFTAVATALIPSITDCA